MTSLRRRIRRSKARRISEAKVKRLRVTALLKIAVPEDLGEGLEAGWGLKITNDRDHINALVSDHFCRVIGVLETNSLKGAPVAIFELTEVEAGAKDDEIRGLNHFMARVQMLTLGLWMVKDNAVDTELGFSEVPHGEDPSRVSSNFLAVSTSTSRGEDEIVSFDRSELEEAAHLLGPVIGDPVFLGDPSNPPNLGRLARAMYLLQAARAHHDLALKTGFYITALEALFSTSSAELSHKLAERVAYFTSPAASGRPEVYAGLKGAYSIRSSAMHGDAPSKKLRSGLADRAEFCDGVIRTALKTILGDSELRTVFESSAKLEAYMQELTLGVAQPPGSSVDAD